MIIEAFNEPQPKEEVLRLKLMSGSGGVDLVAVDENGERIDGGFLARVSEEGIMLYPSVTSKVKLPRDSRGRIVVMENC